VNHGGDFYGLLLQNSIDKDERQGRDGQLARPWDAPLPADPWRVRQGCRLVKDNSSGTLSRAPVILLDVRDNPCEVGGSIR